METAIKENLNYPGKLEKLYRSDKKRFEQSFFAIYPDIAALPMADIWRARLAFDHQAEPGRKVLKSDLLFLIISCVMAGFLIKIPLLAGFDPDEYDYYIKNGGIIVFLGLSTYAFLTKSRINLKNLIISLSIFTLSALYVNLLPAGEKSDSINLAYLHLPLFLWFLYGVIFIDFDLKERSKRIDYLKYNGDLAILTLLILIGGGVLTAVTIGLFSAIDLHIEHFYMENIAIIGLVASPIVASYVIRNFPVITDKLAPIIARIFSPLVLITLSVYLVFMFVTGKDPYNDRDFLLVFNLMLLGVMAIVVFSVVGTSTHKKHRFSEWVLFMLSLLTLAIDLVALSAIIYRVGEFGFTPNRTAVLGSNLLIFVHLVLITITLFKVVWKGKEMKSVEQTIAGYLPLYVAWTLSVTFFFPLIFGWR
ncbi:MAG: DUF4153 domain-containing protein [Bacteroidetes bacterium GWD2_45_23]|nr:MAG: DUF4153 domain-containing protein [Bacteroidetes bacterium GWC2_46_850]OFX73675.1 MAG: DUF4153 domain-containing protein [Bacteroidetes bacterium GWC1_47_7]OFX86662.1 MAG: DUF4153 domain-containing protein [Bacteroidetes bacterium GWD2_45_23]HAR38459.1 DUF4153 domain-containing protein [Porphyromonadaceae bacterium]HBB01925.1 DUF4153 domain-containing protein [Porphyromonadaceae bacterium]